MTEQLSIDFSAAAHRRRSDPDTSRAAARSMVGSVDSLLQRIVQAFRDRGPMTRTEVAAIVGLSDYQASKRISDLKNVAAIVDTGERRPGPSGRAQIVWRVSR
jgi:predicted ArsR family transcriptional regulator